MHSSVSSGSDSGIRSKIYSFALTTRGCRYTCMVINSSSGRSCSATHPFRTTKPKIRILGIVVREGCVALHYSVHFFHDFSLSRNDRNRGGGYRRKICTVPTPFLCLPDPLKKMMDSNSGPCVCECVHRYRWLYHSTI